MEGKSAELVRPHTSVADVRPALATNRAMTASWRIVVLALMAIAIVDACSGPGVPPAPLRPTVVGVITAVSEYSTGPLTLEGGVVIAKPLDGRNLGTAPGVGAGDLYLRGEGWYVLLPPISGSDCFSPLAHFGWDRGDHVLLDNGLELAKVPDFLGDGVETAYPRQQVYNRDLYRDPGFVCVAKNGQVEMFVRP